MGMGMRIDFKNLMGMDMGVGMEMTFANRYGCGYNYTRLTPISSIALVKMLLLNVAIMFNSYSLI